MEQEDLSSGTNNGQMGIQNLELMATSRLQSPPPPLPQAKRSTTNLYI